MQRLKDFLARATLFVSILASGTHALGQSCDAELLGSFGGSVLGIAIEDDLAFVAANTGGLMIFDISDPDHPQWLHSMPSIYNAQHIAVRDGVVYLANLWAPGSFLTIIDARDPLHPVPLGEVEVARDARQVVLDGDVAYIVCDDFGVQIVNISNPALPEVIGGVEIDGETKSVYAENGVLYIVESEKLIIADVSDPMDPAVLSELTGFNHASWVDGDGNGQIFINDWDSGFSILDTKDLNAPAVMHQFDLSLYPMGLAYHDGFVYLASSTGGLYIGDVRDPLGPTVSGPFDAAGGLTRVSADGDMLYFAGLDEDFGVLDIQSPAAPELLFQTQVPNNIRTVSVQDSGVLALDHSDGLMVFDLQDPQRARVLNTMRISGQTYDMQVDGDIAYVSAGVGLSSGSLRVIDISDPADMHTIGIAATDDRVLRSVVNGSVAYIVLDAQTFGLGPRMLGVVDLSDPMNPELVRSIISGIQGDIQGLIVVGDYLYVSVRNTGILIFDIRDPLDPLRIGVSDVVANPTEILVQGNIAYVLQTSQGLSILDISDPLGPVLLSSIDNNTLWSSHRMNLLGSTIYIAGEVGGMGGIIAIDVADPFNPDEVLTLDSIPEVYHFAFDGSRLYAGGRTTGLHWLDLANCPGICLADFNGDNALDSMDVLGYLDAFAQLDLAADFTGDGTLDIFDVFAFLDLLNAGCP